MEHIYQLLDVFVVTYFVLMSVTVVALVLATLVSIGKWAGPWFWREHVRHGFWGWMNWVAVACSAAWVTNMLIKPPTERWFGQDEASMLLLDVMMVFCVLTAVTMFFGHRQGWLRH